MFYSPPRPCFDLEGIEEKSKWEPLFGYIEERANKC